MLSKSEDGDLPLHEPACGRLPRYLQPGKKNCQEIHWPNENIGPDALNHCCGIVSPNESKGAGHQGCKVSCRIAFGEQGGRIPLLRLLKERKFLTFVNRFEKIPGSAGR